MNKDGKDKLIEGSKFSLYKEYVKLQVFKPSNMFKEEKGLKRHSVKVIC